MTTFKKQYKDIYNQYSKQLLAVHKNNFDAINNGLDYFINYLKFLRDYHILTTEDTDNKDFVDFSIVSLVAACDEYEKYKICTSMLKDKSLKKETLDSYEDKRNKHWLNFWQLVAANIES